MMAQTLNLTAPVGQPYPGLRPYREEEQGRFFGRDVDKAVLVDKILNNRLTLLFAASGVGKSSLLQAAVIPYLRAPAGENLTVVYHMDWVADPLSGLRAAVLASLRQQGVLPADMLAEGETLAELLAFCSLFVRTPLVLVLDQFEEFFRYQQHSHGFRPFLDELTRVLVDPDLPVNVLVSMREDFALELNAFKPRLPTLLFENFYRLEKLDRLSAERAIVDPARLAGCGYEPELLAQLLVDLVDKGVQAQGGAALLGRSVDSGAGLVDPPYLQIVCARLWQLKGDEACVRLATYQGAGGVDGILRYFLDDALGVLTHAEKKLASRAFDYLAARRGLKMAYPVDVLAHILRVKEVVLGRVLAKLARRGMNILRDQTRQGVVWYELYHDMFSDSIEQWNRAWKERQHQRRQRVMLALLLVAGLVFAVLADSLYWIYKNDHFPVSYLFKEQEFRLRHWGVLPELPLLPEMVVIPKPDGPFQVGERGAGFGEEYNQFLKQIGVYTQQNFGYPPATVTLGAAFAVGRYEVTYEQYDYYVWLQHRAGVGVETLRYPTGASRDNQRGSRPVTQVSWHEAQGYVQWLAGHTGQEYRLPTEAEWEYAARAGSSLAYPWGDEVGSNRANCRGCGSDWDNQLLAPVGSFPPNAWGVHDTAGNVWEWTCSVWQADFNGDEAQCAGGGSESGRVIRGGSWYDGPDWVRSSARFRFNTDNRGDYVGFRVFRFSRQDN